jgi:hypothetical protein
VTLEAMNTKGPPGLASLRRSLAAVAVLVALLVCAAPSPAAAARLGRLDTAIQEPALFNSGERSDALRHVRAAGAGWIKVDLEWDAVAPGGSQRPAGFDAANPFEGRYDWDGVDDLIRDSTSEGLHPFISVHDAPAWAERAAGGAPGTNNPAPEDVADFFTALARRYSGSFEGLPRVAAFEVWNEVNASFFFMPQKDGNGRPVSPEFYRAIVNRVAGAIHAVHPDNLMIAGGLFPFFIDRPAAQSVAPLRFMRQLLCMSKRLRPKTGCGPAVAFDVWSHHPYTEGSPTHKTGNPDSVSISGLPAMGKLLRAAVRYGRVQSSGPVQFWVSEWAWDSNPPDPQGVPQSLHARWVSEALYRMWDAGVSLATWFFLRDGAGQDARFQSGLYSRCADGVYCDRAKPSLVAFRFPFVAFRGAKGVRIWGRTPTGYEGGVVIERSRRGKWTRVRSVRTNSAGIFTKLLPKARRGRYRARIPGEASLGFSLKRPADFRVSPPVG